MNVQTILFAHGKRIDINSSQNWWQFPGRISWCKYIIGKISKQTGQNLKAWKIVNFFISFKAIANCLYHLSNSYEIKPLLLEFVWITHYLKAWIATNGSTSRRSHWVRLYSHNSSPPRRINEIRPIVVKTWQSSAVGNVLEITLHPGEAAILMLQKIEPCVTETASPSPDVNHLLTEKHWLQLMVTTAGEGTVESVLAATWVTGTSPVTLKVKYIPVEEKYHARTLAV